MQYVNAWQHVPACQASDIPAFIRKQLAARQIACVRAGQLELPNNRRRFPLSADIPM